MIVFPHEHGERRIVPRHKVMKAGKIIVGGKIILGKRAFVIDCTVQNLSSTGAAIRLPDAATVPPKFDLCFDNAIRHCTVVWRQADRMGVKFGSPSMLTKDAARRIAVNLAKLPELLGRAAQQSGSQPLGEG
jgi:hypothetical protein